MKENTCRENLSLQLDTLLEEYSPIKMNCIHKISNAVILTAIEKIVAAYKKDNTNKINLLSFLSFFGLLIGLVLSKFPAVDRKKMLNIVNQLLDARSEDGNFSILHLLPSPEIISTIKRLLSHEGEQHTCIKITNEIINMENYKNITQDLNQLFSMTIDRVTQQFDQRNPFYHDLLFFFLIDITHFILIIGYSKRIEDENTGIKILVKKVQKYIHKTSGYTEVQISENERSLEIVH